MQSFSRGWSFLQQAWQMAFKDKDLIKPSIYALIIGTIVSVIGSIPIIVVLEVEVPPDGPVGPCGPGAPEGPCGPTVPRSPAEGRSFLCP